MARRAFELLHPACSLLYFAALLVVAMTAMHPVFLLCAWAGSLACCAGLAGWRQAARSLSWQLGVVVVVAVANCLFVSSGSTEIVRVGTRAFYAEALAYGACAGLMLACVLLVFSNASRVLSSDKVMAVLGRAVPTVALMVSMTMRLVPQFAGRGRAIGDAARACTAAAGPRVAAGEGVVSKGAAGEGAALAGVAPGQVVAAERVAPGHAAVARVAPGHATEQVAVAQVDPGQAAAGEGAALAGAPSEQVFPGRNVSEQVTSEQAAAQQPDPGQESTPEQAAPAPRRARARENMRLVTVLMGWGMEDALETADAMKARGWGVSRQRTTYARYRFRTLDAAACILVALLAVASGACAWAACAQFSFYPVLAGLAPWYVYVPFALFAFLPTLAGALLSKEAQ